MIQSLTLRNFKCFAEQEVKFAPLTLLVGANAAGKSSVIHALLLLRQSHLAGKLAGGELLLRGDLINVGTQSDVFRYDPERTDDKMGLALTDDQGAQYFGFTFDVRRSGEYLMYGEPGGPARGSLFEPAFNYLNAERVGPRLLYPIGADAGWAFDVGAQGQYATAILGRNQNWLLETAMMEQPGLHEEEHILKRDPDMPLDPPKDDEYLSYPRDEDESDMPIEVLLNDIDSESPPYHPPRNELYRPLGDEVTRWMQEIVPGFQFSAQIVEQTDQAILLMRTNPRQNFVRATNIGFGLIYTLPIVVAALVAPAGSMLIVENPEAHLHPRSQSIMGRFLARVAAAGVQVVVETHSDHILNGIRVAVREGAWGQKLAADDVAIQYFVSSDAEGPHRVRTPKMYPNGGIRPWPKGFFDQYESDLRKLL